MYSRAKGLQVEQERKWALYRNRHTPPTHTHTHPGTLSPRLLWRLKCKSPIRRGKCANHLPFSIWSTKQGEVALRKREKKKKRNPLNYSCKYPGPNCTPFLPPPPTCTAPAPLFVKLPFSLFGQRQLECALVLVVLPAPAAPAAPFAYSHKANNCA